MPKKHIIIVDENSTRRASLGKAVEEKFGGDAKALVFSSSAEAYFKFTELSRKGNAPVAAIFGPVISTGMSPMQFVEEIRSQPGDAGALPIIVHHAGDQTEREAKRKKVDRIFKFGDAVEMTDIAAAAFDLANAPKTEKPRGKGGREKGE